MKLYIVIGLLSLLLFSGCNFEQRQREKNAQAFAAMESCTYQPGHYWSNDEQVCKQRPDIVGCKNLNRFERIEANTLPIGYENITDNYYNYDEGIDIRIFCVGWLLKNDNESCDVLYYRLENTKRNGTLELCWN